MQLLSQSEVARIWEISPKTLERWRTEKRGPPYLKLGKSVRYRRDDIEGYELDQRKLADKAGAEPLNPPTVPTIESPAPENESQKNVNLSVRAIIPDPNFIAVPDAIRIFKIPAYYFSNARVRQRKGIPHYVLGNLVRFKPNELCQWVLQRDEKVDAKSEAPLDPPRPLPTTKGAVPAPRKMMLHDALRHLKRGADLIP